MDQKRIELRKRMKTRKPRFLRQDAHKKKRLKQKWRRPRGLQSKLRLQNRGRRKTVSSGYRNPRAVRGLTIKGLEPVTIYSVAEVRALDPAAKSVCIAKSVGTKKRVEIVKEAQMKNVQILNVRDPATYIASIEEKFEKKRKEKREKENKDKPKKPQEKKEGGEVQEEEKKEAEKKEKDKLLTKRGR